MKRLLLLLAALNISAFADEPSWTDEEREKHRDSVLEGEVITKQRVSTIDKFADLYLAEIKVIEVKKGRKFTEGMNLNVYYEFLPDVGRCPRFPEIKLGEIADFYLVEFNEVSSERMKVAEPTLTDMILQMDSDIRRKKTEPVE